MIVEPALQQFFSHQAPLGCDEPIVVAFSGGPDSLGLAYALKRLAASGRGRPVLCHVDHQMDPDSGRRAQRALAIAGELDLDCKIRKCSIDPAAKSRWGTEAAARQARYKALETDRQEAHSGAVSADSERCPTFASGW
ncbi:MAG: ATP-binding protein [Acidobacteriota bacterium]